MAREKRTKNKRDVAVQEAETEKKSVKSVNNEVAANEAPAKPQAKAKAKKSAKRKVGALSHLRSFMPVAVVLVCAVAFVANVPLGNISTFGWEAISAICPVGALSILLSSKAMIPRALVSLGIAAVLILLFGRAFCSWICTVPLVQRTLGIRSASKQDLRRDQHDRERKAARRHKSAKKDTNKEKAPEDASASVEAPEVTIPSVQTAQTATATQPLTDEEREQIKAEMHAVTAGGCGGHLFDSRHLILGGSLLAALIFGFPVFCLLCPIGLAFASVYLVLRLFTGQFSWAIIVVPIMLVAELLIFRRWCYRICPISALFSLVSRGNRTFVPAVDATKCLVTAKGKSCSACNTVCPEGIDLHDYTKGELGINECIKCRKCVDACPTHAITLPLMFPKDRWPNSSAYGPVMLEEWDASTTGGGGPVPGK